MEPNTAIPTEHAAAEASAPASGSGLNRFFGAQAQQKLLAFLSLIVMFIFFSFASPYFAQMDNVLAIMQATAVDGVLGISATFVIITAGIDLSVGTLMTFCAVMTGVVLTNWGMPLWLGVLASIATGAFCGADFGLPDRQAEDPAVHRHARHDVGRQGPIAGRDERQANLLQRYAELRHDFSGVADWLLRAERADSQRRPHSVRPRDRRLGHPQSHRARALHLRARQQRGGGAAVGRQRRRVENRGLFPGRGDHRRRRPDHRLTPQLGPARARPGLRARGDRRRASSAALRWPAAREPSSARSLAPSS